MNPVVTNVLGGTYSTTQNSDAVSMARSQGVASSFTFTGSTANATTALSGSVQVDTITFAAKAATAAGDFVVVPDQTGGKWAVATNKKDVKTITCPSFASATAGDYIVLKDVSGNSWAAGLQKVVAVSDVKTVTFPTKSAAAGGDYIKIVDKTGGTWAVALNKSGTDTAPTGASWVGVAANHKAFVNISAVSTAAAVAALCVSALNGLVGFSAKITLHDNTDGTVTFTAFTSGPVANFVPHNTGDTGAGSITVVNTTPGTNADATPTGALWTAVASAKKTFVNISGATTAIQVATAVTSALNALSTFTSHITLSAVGDGTITCTASALGAVANFVPKNSTDAGAGSITVANTIVGANTPSGVLWSSVASANKVVVDISSTSTAAQVATAVRAGLAGLTGISAVITVGAASGANIPLTQVNRGLMADPTPSNGGETAIGSITVAQTTPGVTSAVNVTKDTLTIASHGYSTGLKGQFTTTGTLPAGLSLLTDYFVVRVDANTIKIATSLANALAGTVVDITNQGASGSTNTFTPASLAGGSLKLQQSIDKINWFDISGDTASITTSGTAYFNNADLYGQYVRAVFTCTAGQVAISGVFCTKDM